jgi:hypothetical protein
MMWLSTYRYRCIYRDGRRSTAALATVVLAPHDGAQVVNDSRAVLPASAGIEKSRALQSAVVIEELPSSSSPRERPKPRRSFGVLRLSPRLSL